MAENTFKTNTFKKPEKEKKGKSSKSKGKFNWSLDFLKDPRFVLATGFVLIISSIFLFVSFVSFLFTWSADMSIIVPNGDSGVLEEAKEDALRELTQKAQAMGANGILAVDLDFETVGGSMLMVIATGTAVRI